MLSEELISKLRDYAETTLDNPITLDQGLLMDDDIKDLLDLGCLIVIEKSNAICITQRGLDVLGLPPSAGEGTRRIEEFVTGIWHGVLPDWEKQKQEIEERRPAPLSPSTVEGMRQLLLTKLSDVSLSKRAFFCLKAAGIDTFADLVSYSRSELMKFRNFGRKSLNEIDALIENMNLSFGMDVTKYNIEPKKMKD